MIERYCEVDDPLMGPDLRRIDAAIFGPRFLIGLEAGAANAPSPSGFPVVSNIEEARALLYPDMFDDDESDSSFHEINGVVADEDMRMNWSRGMSESWRNHLDEKYAGFAGKLNTAVTERTVARLEELQLQTRLASLDPSVRPDEKVVASMLETFIPHFVSGFVGYMVKAVYFGGLDNSRINTRILEAFEAGGFPCGWVGDMPEDGGDPVKSIVLFHFGASKREP